MKWKKFLTKKNYLSVNLIPVYSGHYVVKVLINGQKARFILDTGASNTCLGMDRAAFFGISARSTDTKATGAGSTGIEMMLAHGVQIRIGKRVFEDYDIALLDLTHINMALENFGIKPVDGVIGADILSHAEAVIHYGKNKLFLKKSIFRY